MSERLNGYRMDEWANQSAPRNKEREAEKAEGDRPDEEAPPEPPAHRRPRLEP